MLTVEVDLCDVLQEDGVVDDLELTSSVSLREEQEVAAQNGPQGGAVRRHGDGEIPREDHVTTRLSQRERLEKHQIY